MFLFSSPSPATRASRSEADDPGAGRAVTVDELRESPDVKSSIVPANACMGNAQAARHARKNAPAARGRRRFLNRRIAAFISITPIGYRKYLLIK